MQGQDRRIALSDGNAMVVKDSLPIFRPQPQSGLEILTIVSNKYQVKVTSQDFQKLQVTLFVGDSVNTKEYTKADFADKFWHLLDIKYPAIQRGKFISERVNPDSRLLSYVNRLQVEYRQGIFALWVLQQLHSMMVLSKDIITVITAALPFGVITLIGIETHVQLNANLSEFLMSTSIAAVQNAMRG